MMGMQGAGIHRAQPLLRGEFATLLAVNWSIAPVTCGSADDPPSRRKATS
jgi:hypothetical protein